MSVLEVMDEAAKFLRDGDYGDEADDIMKARASVAELIEASRKYLDCRNSKRKNMGQLVQTDKRLRAALDKASP